MDDVLLSDYILLIGGFDASTDELSYTAATNNTIANGWVVDVDASNTVSTGDHWFGTSFPYAGFTVTIAGNEYAVFQLTTSPAFFYIPHNGEISTADLDASPISVTVSANATVVNCFLAGTRIATPNGETAVERLAPGDLVTAADGRAVPVLWVGRQTVSTRFGPAARLMPVRVRAGALGGGLPRRDLTLTADHALLIDGLLVNAGALVNGGSIDCLALSELGDSYTVYHVETEAHDIILAEGAPTETYIDYVGRQAFDNYADYVALYGEDRVIGEMPYPRISTARLLPSGLRARLGITKAA